MSIPKIEDYALHAPELSATNKLDWIQDSARSILLVHDMQQYFLNFLPAMLRRTLIEHCQDLIAYARRQRIPVVYTAQCGGMSKKERGLLHDLWGPGMSNQPEHTAIAPELAPQASDTVLAKWRYSAFHASALQDIFLQEKRDQLMICGVFAHVGVLASAMDAYSRDIEVFLVQDAIADFSKEAHVQALAYAAKCCAKVVARQELCA